MYYEKKKKLPNIILYIVLAVLIIAAVLLSISIIKSAKAKHAAKASVSITAAVPKTTSEPTSAGVMTSKASSQSTTSSAITVSINPNKWYLTVVSQKYKLPDDYAPALSNIEGSDYQLDARVAPSFDAMYEAAKKEGITLNAMSAYRSIAKQTQLFNNKIQQYVDKGCSRKDAEKKAAEVVLPPGTSEHNFGLSLDLCSLETNFDKSNEYKWLCEHAADYGFILRYPKDKINITKETYEPWHWRYVGITDAKKIKASGKCLEEYVGVSNN